MTGKWMFPVWVAAVAGVIGFSMTRHAAREADGPELDRLRDVTFLTRTLRLNDAQAREIENMHVDLGARLKDCCDRHCAARKRLGRLLVEDNGDAERIDAILHEMCNAYAESERRAIEHIQRVRELLDPEQRRRFNELVVDALLCNHCPVCVKETRNPSRETIHGGGFHGNATLLRGTENEEAGLEPGAPTGDAWTQPKREHS